MFYKILEHAFISSLVESCVVIYQFVVKQNISHIKAI